MATIEELFSGAPGAARASVATAKPEQPTPAGAPPGDNRYGKASPLTDQFAGRTLAQLLDYWQANGKVPAAQLAAAREFIGQG